MLLTAKIIFSFRLILCNQPTVLIHGKHFLKVKIGILKARLLLMCLFKTIYFTSLQTSNYYSYNNTNLFPGGYQFSDTEKPSKRTIEAIFGKFSLKCKKVFRCQVPFSVFESNAGEGRRLSFKF